MTGQQLGAVLTLVKGEIGLTGTGDDALLNQMIVNKQAWFCAKWNWAVLDTVWDVTASASTQYLSFPSTDILAQSATLRLDRPFQIEGRYNDLYRPLYYGIGAREYNLYDFANNGDVADPLMRWKRVGTDVSKFEVWPVPETAQTIRFFGQRTPVAITISVSTSIVSLDDMLIALAVATDFMKMKGKSGWDSKAAQFRELWGTLRGTDPQELHNFRIGADDEGNGPRRVVPIKISTTA